MHTSEDVEGLFLVTESFHHSHFGKAWEYIESLQILFTSW